jgi:hypothetical protein
MVQVTMTVGNGLTNIKGIDESIKIGNGDLVKTTKNGNLK